MDINTDIVQLLTQYHLPGVFVGAFLFGETVILTAAYLAAQLNWSVPILCIVAFGGTLLADVTWFLFGKYLLRKSNYEERYKEKYEKLAHTLRHVSKTRPFLALLYIKFLYGTRVLTILYVAWKKVTLQQFLIYDSLGTIIWLCVLIPIGWLAGKGVANLTPVLNTVEYVLLSIVILVVLVKGISLWFTKRIENE